MYYFFLNDAAVRLLSTVLVIVYPDKQDFP